MNGYYQQQYNDNDTAHYGGQEGRQPHHNTDIAANQMSGSQSLEEIVNQNAKEMRRRTMPQQYGMQSGDPDGSLRRATMGGMMDFGGTSPHMDNFQFNPSLHAGAGFESLIDMSTEPDTQRQNGSNANNLSVDTDFLSPGLDYNVMQQQNSGFDSGMSNTPLDMDMISPYLTSNFSNSMALGPNMHMMGGDMSSTDMFDPEKLKSPMGQSSIYGSVMMSSQRGDPNSGSGNGQSRPGDVSGSTTVNSNLDRPPQTRQASSLETQSLNSRQGNSTAQSSAPIRPSEKHYSPSKVPRNPPGPHDTINGNALPWAAPPGGWPSSIDNRPHMTTQFKDAYAPSGYDLMSILIKVASRPNPQINIGSVDLSCAFVVCNTRVHDAPIEYCSESFERLTGYTRHEILGQNCRFLQSPDGKVTPGIKRKYCDDDSVLYLKNSITTQTESQISLINYRKGGQPFMNLLTMIPIGDENGISHFVGFQVDLVENPTAIYAKNPDGTYSIDYQRHESMPSYFLQTPQSTSAEVGQTIPRDEVSTVLGTIGTNENELSRRLMDKVLLENSDDVIHVLSLKGLFLYLSPSCQKTLEYSAAELVGTPLSSICHPSDIVPVTRELKDPSSGAALSVVFRIRRKTNGYMWFESHGSLHTEQGKGRKCIILVGRERPVYTLNKSALMSGGGIGENELWAKMSTTGMFLYVLSNVRQLLDRQPEELVGTNIQHHMRPDSREEFGRILAIALTGQNTSLRHEMTNKRGQVLQAYSWIFPGDATEGMKPTFLVAQIRLIRYHRGGGSGGATGARPSLLGQDTQSDIDGFSKPQIGVGSATPFSTTSGTVDTTMYKTQEGHPTTHAGQGALILGKQDAFLASDDNVFDELKTTRSTSWQFELRQMEKRNRLLAEEVQNLIAAKKKRKRRRGAGLLQKDCANCHTKNTPEWRRGPSGQRDLCNSCGLRWAKQQGRVSPRSRLSDKSVNSDRASKASASPRSDHVATHDILASNVASAEPTEKGPVMSASEKRASAQEASLEKHAAKVARMEGQGGIPAKIEEGIEPLEEDRKPW